MASPRGNSGDEYAVVDVVAARLEEIEAGSPGFHAASLLGEVVMNGKKYRLRDLVKGNLESFLARHPDVFELDKEQNNVFVRLAAAAAAAAPPPPPSPPKKLQQRTPVTPQPSPSKAAAAASPATPSSAGSSKKNKQPQRTNIEFSDAEDIRPELASHHATTFTQQMAGLSMSTAKAATATTTAKNGSSLKDFFFRNPERHNLKGTSTHGKKILFYERDRTDDPPTMYGLMGTDDADDPVYLNTQEPFALVAVGVQGAGKSHSINAVIENCMLNAPPYIAAPGSTCALVFHFDPSPANVCETLALTMRRPNVPDSVPTVEHLTVLVSPSFYSQRKSFYKDSPKIKVQPLLFSWKDLDASQLRTLMRIDAGDDMPLYMSSILDLLRKYQKAGKLPSYKEFKAEVENQGFNTMQTGPLQQRLCMLESFIADSDENLKVFKSTFAETHPRDISHLFADSNHNQMIVVDLTDPLLTGSEANAIFQVVLSKFLSTPRKISNKMVVFDEAHKYLQEKTDPLSQTLVSTVRQMRHLGVRIVVSTQSPHTLPPELLELVTVTLLHRFQSRDWFHFLKTKLALDEGDFDDIVHLGTGQALAFSLYWSDTSKIDTDGELVRRIFIRPRLTTDAGVSRN